MQNLECWNILSIAQQIIVTPLDLIVDPLLANLTLPLFLVCTHLELKLNLEIEGAGLLGVCFFHADGLKESLMFWDKCPVARSSRQQPEH